jgi:hypothetical protein
LRDSSNPSISPTGRAAICADREATRRGVADHVEGLAPALRRLVVLSDRERDRDLGVLRHPQHHRQIFVEGGEIEHELKHAAADIMHRTGDRGQFILAGLQGRGEISGGGPVIQGARGRKSERAGADGVAREGRHRLVVFRCRRVAAGAALAHHIDAKGGVRQLRADIHVEMALR